jgi:dihydrolipoamide dehydrogenase
MATIEVKVPDIGDFEGVPVIEVLVKAGDAVKAEDALVTLESDKATMDVPSPAAGTVSSVAVKVGDKVSEGSLVLVLETAAAATAAPTPAARPAAPVGPASAGPGAATSRQPSAASGTGEPRAAAGSYAGKVDVECEMLVLGAGPGGYRPRSAPPTSA